MSLTASIKVSSSLVSAKGIAAIRKTTGFSIAEIKSLVSSDSPVIECSVSDSNGVARIISLGHMLKSLGIETQMYLGSHAMPATYFINRLRSAKEDIIQDGEEDVYQDEPWWNLDLSKFE